MNGITALSSDEEKYFQELCIFQLEVSNVPASNNQYRLWMGIVHSIVSMHNFLTSLGLALIAPVQECSIEVDHSEITTVTKPLDNDANPVRSCHKIKSNDQSDIASGDSFTSDLASSLLQSSLQMQKAVMSVPIAELAIGQLV